MRRDVDGSRGAPDLSRPRAPISKQVLPEGSRTGYCQIPPDIFRHEVSVAALAFYVRLEADVHDSRLVLKTQDELGGIGGRRKGERTVREYVRQLESVGLISSMRRGTGRGRQGLSLAIRLPALAHPFIRVQRAWAYDPVLTDQELMQLVLLESFRGREDGLIFPTVSTQAARSGMGRSQIYQQIASLEAKGYLRRTPGRKRRKTYYDITDVNELYTWPQRADRQDPGLIDATDRRHIGRVQPLTGSEPEDNQPPDQTNHPPYHSSENPARTSAPIVSSRTQSTQEVQLPGRRGRGDLAWLLAEYFKREQNDPCRGANQAGAPVTTGALAKHFKDWLAEGVPAKEIQAMIDLFLARPLTDYRYPWKKFLSERHGLIDQVRHDGHSHFSSASKPQLDPTGCRKRWLAEWEEVREARGTASPRFGNDAESSTLNPRSSKEGWERSGLDVSYYDTAWEGIDREPLERVARYLEHFPEHAAAGQGIILAGPPNAKGKGLLAHLAADAALTAGMSVTRIAMTGYRELLASVIERSKNLPEGDRQAGDEWMRLRKEVDHLFTTEFLLIEDIGMEPRSPSFYTEGRFHHLLDERIGHLRTTVMTTVVPLTRWTHAYSASTHSRVFRACWDAIYVT